jgi:hypothetical protein
VQQHHQRTIGWPLDYSVHRQIASLDRLVVEILRPSHVTRIGHVQILLRRKSGVFEKHQ